MFANHPRVRVGIYLLSVAAQIAAVFVALYNDELAGAFVASAGILAALASATALSNITPADAE